MSLISIKRQLFVVEILSFALIVLFAYAAIIKLLDYSHFQIELNQSPLLAPYTKFIAWPLPGLELIVSGFLAFPATRGFGLYASFFLMIMFSAYIVAITKFSPFIPCSCGGILESMTWNQHLVFNLLVASLVAFGILALNPIPQQQAPTD